MVNILPKETQNSVRTLYYLRLLTVLFFLIALALLIGAGLLAPSYLLANQEAAAAKEYSTALQQTLALKESAGASGQLTALAEELSLIKQYQSKAVVADVLTALTEKLPKGVSVTKVAIAPPTTADGKIGLIGSAKTRAELLAYVNTLQQNTLFANVAVPVSDLATDTNIPFSLTFTLVKSK